MLWLCLHFPQLPAEALGLDDPLAAVTEQRGSQRWLITAAAGIAAGTALGTALAVQPQLRAQPRKRAAENAALLQLAHGMYRYGSPVCTAIREFDETGRCPQALLWVEVSASLQLFGGLQALCEAVQTALRELGQHAQLALAPTRAAAALFALQALPGTTSRTALDAALATLPIEALPWPQAQLDALQGLGLRQLGELLRLPRSAFARRFGTTRLRELDRLRGHAAEPAQAITPPPQFCRRFELASEVENVEALQFPLRRLAFELQGWLRARDLGVRRLRLGCQHAQRRRSQLQISFGSTHRDGRRIFETLRERLQRAPLPGAVRALELEATELGEASVEQADLFDPHNSGDAWLACIERIRARLGSTAVWTPQCRDDHRPEHALQRSEPAAEPAAERDDGDAPAMPRPLWLLPQAQALAAPPAAALAVERIASGWGDGQDARRDYYIVEHRDAAAQLRAWVFYDRESKRWFLHGLWG